MIFSRGGGKLGGNLLKYDAIIVVDKAQHCFELAVFNSPSASNLLGMDILQNMSWSKNGSKLILSDEEEKTTKILYPSEVADKGCVIQNISIDVANSRSLFSSPPTSSTVTSPPHSSQYTPSLDYSMTSNH